VGQKVWFGTQINVTSLIRGFRTSSDFRVILGEATPAGLTTTNSKGYIGIKSGTAPAYSSAITAFPASGALLAVGNEPIGSGAANTISRPSIYFKGDWQSSAATTAGTGGGSLVTGIEVF
jgi:hypothetical protein